MYPFRTSRALTFRPVRLARPRVRRRVRAPALAPSPTTSSAAPSRRESASPEAIDPLVATRGMTARRCVRGRHAPSAATRETSVSPSAARVETHAVGQCSFRVGNVSWTAAPLRVRSASEASRSGGGESRASARVGCPTTSTGRPASTPGTWAGCRPRPDRPAAPPTAAPLGTARPGESRVRA
ncbi:MAG: hypothetical protein JWM31_1853 [Solirubrobacterales bacterium]|nr:hypothetical protein [Solirubrobacterales bacterium]